MSGKISRAKFIYKLGQMHWSLVALVLTLGIIGCAMMYSAGGGHFHPWADNQIIRFGLGIVILFSK